MQIEVYLDKEGANYENIGVPVDFKLDYSRDRQAFFKSVINDLEVGKQCILEMVDTKKEIIMLFPKFFIKVIPYLYKNLYLTLNESKNNKGLSETGHCHRLFVGCG